MSYALRSASPSLIALAHRLLQLAMVWCTTSSLFHSNFAKWNGSNCIHSNCDHWIVRAFHFVFVRVSLSTQLSSLVKQRTRKKNTIVLILFLCISSLIVRLCAFTHTRTATLTRPYRSWFNNMINWLPLSNFSGCYCCCDDDGGGGGGNSQITNSTDFIFFAFNPHICEFIAITAAFGICECVRNER